MRTITIKVRVLKCRRCGREWQPKAPMPKVCRFCKSPNWDIPAETNPKLRRNDG